MSTFIQKLNPITGSNDWTVQPDDYDYHQEVARSSFADMLHDTERNKKYELALKSAIEQTHARGKLANVLDIGTGTGLLSMMAIKHGADTVTACEAFNPIAECALKIIKHNGYEHRIKVIPKRSTDLTVGPNCDLESRCNILVTEVFDTELIGEGALSTFSHAHKVLLENECIVVPQSATIYAQIAESPLVHNWNKVKDVYDDEGQLVVKVPKSVRNCAGASAVHDLQLSQLKLESVKMVAPPVPVLRFDWSGRTPIVFERSTIHSIKAAQTATAHVIFMWWSLEMDTEGKVELSCAPYWAHPEAKNKTVIPWRDHWMQAIYYLPNELLVTKDSEIHLISCHDEYSLWFNLKPTLQLTDADYVKPTCECGLHMTVSRTRIGQINDSNRIKKYLSLMEKHINPNSVVLVLSDGFYSSLTVAKLAKKVYYVETNPVSRKILLDFVKCNEISNVEVFENIETLLGQCVEKIDIVLGEPYFLNSILPWDNLLFIYLLKGVKHVLSSEVKVFPQIAVIKGIAVRFSDLNKIRSKLGECEGFSMKDFDDLIEASSGISDENVEAQPLWEYPGLALSKIVDLITIDSSSVPEKVIEQRGEFEIETGEGCNGVALWVDWKHEEGSKSVTISSGPIFPPQMGQKIEWDVHTRQGVCLFPERVTKSISYVFKFDFNEGNISFKC